MHKLKSLALLALAGLGLSAFGGVTTNDWWDVPFTSPTATTNVPGYGGVALTIGELGALTNDFVKSGTAADPLTWQPYLAGLWTMVDGDESYVTNEFNPTNTWKAFGGDNCLKLDTQGNDLTWTVEQDNVMADGLKALVDADLYLVGSDSPPDAADFDAAGDVQTAVYLKNETDEDSGETTNSVLCVYVRSDEGDNYWQELDGVKLEDNAWAHVQVLVDHSTGDLPEVKVYVNGTEMHARNGTGTFWTAANGSTSAAAKKVSSVAFRGTGAVDNFVGQTILETKASAYFKAVLHLDNGIMDELVTDEKLTIDNRTTADFTGLEWEGWDIDNDCPDYGLSKVEIVDFVNGGVRTHDFTYDPDDPDEVYISPTPTEGEVRFGFSGKDLDGLFSVYAPTVGATAPADPDEPVTIAHIYFKSAYAKNAYATTSMDGNVTTNAYIVKPVDFAEGATKTLTWEFPATDGGNVLSTIRVHNGAAFVGCANRIATVSVTLDEELDADTLFAEATYVAGTLADGQDLKDDGGVDGLYTFTAYVPPVAMIGTVEYPSLRAAIEAAQAGDTIVMVADDAVSFTAENPILDLDFEVTIDGGSNTLYGMTGYAAGYHEIRVGGSSNVTIKDLKLTEFGDTAVRNDSVMPIVARSAYTGKLTLDGVQIDKFNRQALCLFGGTFEITNCVITGLAEGTEYFQSAIEVFNASGTVADTTISGIGSNLPDWGAASCFTLNSDWSQTPWVGGTGSITILSGSYTGQYIALGMTNAAQTVEIQGGTFIATAPATESAFGLDGEDPEASITISGGWFDREPEAKYIAAGLAAYEDAPGEDAPWTVRAAKVTIDFYVDGAVYATTSVVVGATGYAPADPEKAADAQYAYAFIGWTNVVGESYSAATLPAATTATNYYAAFSVVVRSYEVEWVVDGVYTTNTWNYDATPSWNENDPTAVPTKDSTEATNFTFKAWTPEVAPVTGPGASYTATWTETVREYTVTWVIDATTSNMVQVAYGTVPAYAGEAPAKEGYTFLGWNSDSTATEALATLPAVTGEATYYAVFQEDTPVVVKVNPGDGLKDYVPGEGETVPAPIEFTDAATPLCKIAFVAPAAGKYVLMTSTTVNGTYEAEGTPVEKAAGDLVELTETSSATTKFFKIGYEK